MRSKQGKTDKKSKAGKDGFVRISEGLYRFESSGNYSYRLRIKGQLHRGSLNTKDIAEARRLLGDKKRELSILDTTGGKMTFRQMCEAYLKNCAGQSPRTYHEKNLLFQNRIIRFQKIDSPIRDITKSDMFSFMSGLKQTPAAFNHHRVFLYQAFQQIGVDGQRIAFNPMSGIKTMKGKNPDRKRPSWEQFKAIIADVRSQKYNASVQESGDYLEAMGRLGLGNAELNKMTWGDINFATNEIHVLRKKTVTGFIIPIYPQAKDFLLGLKAKAGNPSPDDKVFSIKSAKKALAQSCARLGLPSYTHISLRRCFISRCLELGIDVQSVAGWQGHQDGGKLILSTYGNVGSHHRQRMAAMLTDETPDNIVSIEKGAANA